MEYKIIAADDHVYGPVDPDTLRQWVKDQRVDAKTWIYESVTDRWQHASKVPALSELFPDQEKDEQAPAAGGSSSLRPGHLRRLKVFAEMSDEMISRFLSLVEPVQIRSHSVIVRQGEPGDCMYLLLEGVVRVRLGSSGKETELARLEAGDFFGEICLFDEGPRSADCVANTDCTLLRIRRPNFHKLMDEQPDAAVRFLFAMIRTVEARIRNQNKKYSDSMSWGRSWKPSSPTLAAAMDAAAGLRPQAGA
jgi:hypothetical protein